MSLIVENLENLAKKVEFLVSLKQKIGEQKIDIVYGRNENRLIDEITKREGILL